MSAATLGRRLAPEGDVYGCAKRVKTYESKQRRGRYASAAFYAWVCQVCGFDICGASGAFDATRRIDEHERLGHTPCEQCGAQIRNCKDGSPRRHAWNRCPGKDESFRVVTVYDRERARAEAA